MSILYITKPGATLRSNAGRFVVTKGEEELESIPQASLDSVILLGFVQVTTQAVHELMERGICVIYLSTSGQFRGILQPSYPRNVFQRIAQYDASQDAVFSLDTARRLVLSKLSSQEKTLRKWARNNWLEEHRFADWIALKAAPLSAPDNNALRGAEAAAAVRYFEGFGETLPPPFLWTGRNRRPPRDPVNALLSFSYMIAVGEAVSACYATGLDPFVGFFHELDYGRPSLALDLIEPIRAPNCDHFVMRLLQREEFRPDDFTNTPEDGCRFTMPALHRFLTAWESPDSARPPRVQLRRAVQRLCRELAAGIRTRQPPDFAADGQEEA
jgi:CRISPR-associated protein Cas1